MKKENFLANCLELEREINKYFKSLKKSDVNPALTGYYNKRTSRIIMLLEEYMDELKIWAIKIAYIDNKELKVAEKYMKLVYRLANEKKVMEIYADSVDIEDLDSCSTFLNEHGYKNSRPAYWWFYRCYNKYNQMFQEFDSLIDTRSQKIKDSTN